MGIKTKMYTSAELAVQARLSLRQVDHWCSKGWLKPAHGNKQGVARVFTKAEVDKARSVGVLIKHGISIETALKFHSGAERRPGGHYRYGTGADASGTITLEWRV